MNKHTLTLVESGRWKVDITTGENSLNHGDMYNRRREIFVEAECSCGEVFYDEEEAMAHITQHQENK